MSIADTLANPSGTTGTGSTSASSSRGMPASSAESSTFCGPSSIDTVRST